MMKAQSDHSDSLVFECDFEEPPEKVWRALTEPLLLAAWLADDPARTGAKAEPAASGPVAGSDRDDRGGGQAGPSEYEIVTAEPHRLLRYRWRDRESGADAPGGREVHSVVTVELAPCPAGGTHLRLTHGQFRIVSAVPSAAARVVPITTARRRRSPELSFAPRASLRRAA